MLKNALCTLLMLAALALRAEAGGGRMDDVQFGDAASEQAHAFAGDKTVSAAGGLGEPCRRIAPGGAPASPRGALVFRLRCAPDQQNYLTVKFWGSDTEAATLFLFDGDKRIGAYGGMRPELDLGLGEAAFPGRFYYTTYMIPREMTEGKTVVTLKLAALGRPSPYAADPAKRQGPQQGMTRGIYRAYTHTDSFFAPGSDERQGAPSQATQRPAPKDGSPLDALRRQADDAVAALLKWQCYGPEWAAAVERGDVPAVLLGAVCRPTRIEKRSASEWKDVMARRISDGNSVAMNVLAIFAKAYESGWTRHHRNPELLARVVKGLDFFCVAQGADGAFNHNTWVGGPDRKPAGSPLEGFGTSGLGQAFLLVQSEPAIKEALDQPVDDDGDPKTPMLPRRTAWAALFAKHRDFLVSERGRGHAPNQDMAQITAMWLANEALRALAPERAWSREKALEYVHSAVGLRKDPLGGRWVTRKGLSLEPWGTLAGEYSGNYGLMAVHEICRLAEITGAPEVRQRALDAIHAAVHFVSPSLDEEGLPCMRKEEIISARITKWPGRVDYVCDEFAAAVLKDPIAVRAAQLAIEQGHPRSVLEEGNAHFVSSVKDALLNTEHFQAMLSLPPATCRLPMEDGEPDFAWADEQAGVVVAKHQGARLYMSLNWRRGFKDNKRDPQHVWVNNIARVHYTTPTLDRIATVAMESPHSFGRLYICRYGKFLIGMNLSEDASHDLDIPADAGTAEDLVSGRRYAAGTRAAIAPVTTLVIWIGGGE